METKQENCSEEGLDKQNDFNIAVVEGKLAWHTWKEGHIYFGDLFDPDLLFRLNEYFIISQVILWALLLSFLVFLFQTITFSNNFQ